MLEPEQIKNQIEGRIGSTHKISAIKKGFSNEEKYEITTDRGAYLLRLSPVKSYVRKKEEFELLVRLYKNGVRCNKPIDIFKHENQEKVYSIFSFLPGYDAESHIDRIPNSTQYEMGLHAGQDLRKINCLTSDTETWNQRKWNKHEYYLKQYFEQDYRFTDDYKVLKFIEKNYDKMASAKDYLQHDDFHLGNIIISDKQYVGILDFNRFDWGDPLHEFVKLEWFTWPVSKEFTRGQIEGYFGKNTIDDVDCLQISIYIAMSILSTIIWTLKFHPHTMTHIEKRMYSILDHYEYFERINPDWAI